MESERDKNVENYRKDLTHEHTSVTEGSPHSCVLKATSATPQKRIRFYCKNSIQLRAAIFYVCCFQCWYFILCSRAAIRRV